MAIKNGAAKTDLQNTQQPQIQQQQPHTPQQQQQQQKQSPESHSVILVTAGYDNTIRFWEALSGICSRTIQHPNSQVNRLCISPDKRYLAAAGNHSVRLYDINSSNPKPITSFGDHTGNITATGFHAECRWMFTGSEDGHLKIWDTRGPVITRQFDHETPINDVVIHPNQGELISCDQNGSVRIWDLSANACTHELVPEEEVPLRSVTVASDGSMLIAANNKGNCYVWQLPKGNESTDLKPITKLNAHNSYITRCILSPDTKHLATCSADKTVKIWNTENGKFTLEKTLVGHQRWVWDCAFSADSAYLVTASSDHTARLWELSQGETIRQYNGHHKAAVCVALNDLSMY
ncbi:hypothetical protein INT43_003877 [Umbelopsis isabellina]|uniref:Target of rapamycin complex subunit LST8 n=1 Tax=Mortierella isabellina TaxID=91625 RepID=A0A8H7PT64_MORIS|nr:hypothetical protein INT43_003877 [Umbelopsis isabellina]